MDCTNYEMKDVVFIETIASDGITVAMELDDK